MNIDPLEEFALRYSSAWCCQEPARVAAFFTESGSLAINGGPPAVGRAAIAAVAQSFMTAFPDLVVFFDAVTRQGELVLFHWTLHGTNNGPGGTGNPVRISGREEWTLGEGGLIAASQGFFDDADYQRQLHAR